MFKRYSFLAVIVSLLTSSISAVPANALVNSTVNCGTSGTFTVELSVVTSNSSCVGSVNVPDGVIEIGVGAFAYASIGSVTLPTSLRVIDVIAFRGYQGTVFVIPEGVTLIGAVAFEGSNIETITFPSTLIEIGHNAFSHSALTSLNLPNSLTTIGFEAFYDVAHYPTLNIPNSVTSVGDYSFAFGGYTKLHIGTGLNVVGSYAFTGISTLTGVYYCPTISSSAVTTYAYSNGLHPICRAFVQFNSNGGAGAMSGQTSSTNSLLQDNTFVRTGYSFDGWSTAPDGSKLYEDKASFSFVGGTDITLFARWNRSITEEEILAAVALEHAAEVARAEITRIADLHKNQAELLRQLSVGEVPSLKLMLASEISGVTEENIATIIAEISNVSLYGRINISTISYIANKQIILDRLSNPATQKLITTRELVEIGALALSNKQKTTIVIGIRKVDPQSLETFEKLIMQIQLQEDAISARKERLVAIIAKVRARISIQR